MNSRAAIYARFSSDLQRGRSIDDQVALCREYAARNGYRIVGTFSDRAITGASLLMRSGIQALLQSARAGEFDFVIAESLSRLARDQEDAPAIRKRLEFAGVKIVTTADGVVSPLMHGLRTIIDAQYLDDLKSAVRRGMAGVIRDGRHAGGFIYGYRSVSGKPGELVTIPHEADIVRRIFREYVAGATPRAIASALNAESIKPPRKEYWRASTINGHTKRKTGILQNELYCGRIIWNRCHRVRDPDTGARIWRYKPEKEWHRAEAAELRIVEDGLFQEAQRLRGVRARKIGGFRARPKRLLSGLLRCGACNAGMSKHDVDHGRPRIVCTRMMESKTCDNRRRYYLDEIERAVVGGLRDELGTVDAVAHFVRCYNDEQRRRSSGGVDRRQSLSVNIANVTRQIERAVTAIIQARITEAEAEAHLPSLRERHAALTTELAAFEKPVPVIELRPAAVDVYLSNLSRLEEAINADLADGEEGPADAVRALIQSVTIVPAPAGTIPGIVVRGDLGSLLDLNKFPHGPHVGGGPVVPGERIELPTNGLQNRCSTAELTRQVGEISLYQRLLALWPAMARAHIARTSNVVPVQITVQFRSPADARFSGLFREAAARSRGIETLQPSTPERRQVCGLALVEAGMTTSRHREVCERSQNRRVSRAMPS
jgi:site-specific DNA recombinase